MDLSLQVIKEPRGFIRIIQCLMAILAFATTAGFSTECSFNIICEKYVDHPYPVNYTFGYPFSHQELTVPHNCDKISEEDDWFKMVLPFDLSNSAEFFVATGVLSFLYTLIILGVYIFYHQTYTSNPKFPVVDLGASAVLTVFWMAGSSAWAEGVSDLKRYLHPDTIFKIVPICISKTDHCVTVEDGTYGVLNASLILGFANFFLWGFSLWFIYKETVFHTPEVPPDTSQNQATKNAGRV